MFDSNFDRNCRKYFLGEEAIEAAVIITREFFSEIESTTSRTLYLNTDDFLQKKENIRKFSGIQNNPYYLAKFMSYYIQWLLEKMEEGKEQEYFETIPKDLQQELADYFQGALSTRIIETAINFQLVSEILYKYFEKSNVNKSVRNEFYEKSRKICRFLDTR